MYVYCIAMDIQCTVYKVDTQSAGPYVHCGVVIHYMG
jgi:hypothetical protein